MIFYDIWVGIYWWDDQFCQVSRLGLYFRESSTPMQHSQLNMYCIVLRCVRILMCVCTAYEYSNGQRQRFKRKKIRQKKKNPPL